MAEDRSYDTSGKLRSYSNDETPLRSTGETVEVTTDISSHSNTSRFTVPTTTPQCDMLKALMAIMDRQAQNERERREVEAEQRRLDREAMLQQFKLQSKKTEREPLHNRLKSELVYRMSSMSDNDDPETYLNSLRSSLTQADVPHDEWKLVLLTKLNDRCKHIVSDIELNGDYDFEEVVDRILASTGNTPTMAGYKLYNLKEKDLAHKHAAEAMELVDRLTSRLARGARDKKETLTCFKTARIRSVQSAEGKRFLDSRNIRTDDDLRDALTDWEATGGEDGI